jgi:ribosomal protein S18 acetylase RimI-like enzyme
VHARLDAAFRYLDVRYSERERPYTDYPRKLTAHLTKEYLRGHAGASLLDLGCGRGEFLHGFAELGMAVACEWRGRGVGSALLAAAIEWAREHGLHKLCLSVFVHNTAAIALYRKLGFVEEGRRVKQYRRASGELWDAIDMGLLL